MTLAVRERCTVAKHTKWLLSHPEIAPDAAQGLVHIHGMKKSKRASCRDLEMQLLHSIMPALDPLCKLQAAVTRV